MSFRTVEDGRNGRRILANTPAWLEARKGELIACILENIGHGGARLYIDPNIAFPSRFTIWLTRDGKVTRSCRVIWQNKDRMGVRFIRTDGSNHTPA